MKTIPFALSPEQRELVVKHGYPFEELAAQLKAAERQKGEVSFALNEFYFDQLLGDLARSINHSRSNALIERLNDLYEDLLSQAWESGYTSMS